ncbi:MAG: ParB/RepB/Spo0J family partition protein [Flavobacteriales bacterium]
MSKKKKSLGKGLSALLEDSGTDITSKYQKDGDRTIGSVSEIGIQSIQANPFQPRRTFDEEALAELTDSVREHGVIQPITVRKMGYDQYQIISGERRFQAASKAGLESLPAHIKVADDQTMLEMALVENLQREDLDAIEVAESYERLIEECEETQESLSKKVGKQRATVTNYLRLLKLPEAVQSSIREGKLSMGHARALINVDNDELRLKLHDRILKEGLSVRKTEELIQSLQEVGKQGKNRKEKAALSAKEQRTLDSLSERLGGKVDLKKDRSGKGRILIDYGSEEELDRIIDALKP